MISQRYWIDKNTPLPLQNSIMNNTAWEKMLSCWRFLGNKDAFLASCHKSIFFPPLSLLATLSSLISSSTKDFSSLASSCMLELPLRKPWGFNKYPTTLYSLCQTVCTGEEKKSMTVMTNFHFLPLSSRLKERYRRTTLQWAHQQRYPLIWWNNEQQYKLNDICLTFCVPFGLLVAATLFHLKSISCWQPWTLCVFLCVCEAP